MMIATRIMALTRACPTLAPTVVWHLEVNDGIHSLPPCLCSVIPQAAVKRVSSTAPPTTAAETSPAIRWLPPIHIASLPLADRN